MLAATVSGWARTQMKQLSSQAGIDGRFAIVLREVVNLLFAYNIQKFKVNLFMPIVITIMALKFN